jgi:hypothetical protein
VITTVRTNISLPRGLKARMEAAQGVNWSAVAADAIRDRLDGGPHELERLREENARLRAALARVRAALDSV